MSHVLNIHIKLWIYVYHLQKYHHRRRRHLYHLRHDNSNDDVHDDREKRTKKECKV